MELNVLCVMHLVRGRQFHEGINQRFDFGVLGQLLQALLREQSPRHAVGIFVPRLPDNNTGVVERHDVARQCGAIRQREIIRRLS